MPETVYADILFIVNTYVTYALLRVTSLFCHTQLKPLRIICASLVGGAFSLVILIKSVPNVVILLSRLAFAAVLVFVCYYPFSRKRFIKLFSVLFAVSFAFAGLMLALWFFVAPRSMLFFGGIVYFNIDTLTLIVLTAVCYGFFKIINALLSKSAPKETTFTLTIDYNEKQYTCKALLDTGNSLYEPFSSLPVIVVNRAVFGENFTLDEKASRVVPCSAIGGDSLLTAFKPTKILLSGAQTESECSDVYVALSDRQIHGGSFQALLHPNLTEIKQSEEKNNAFKT